MDKKRLFKDYNSRLVREGMLKALICALITGFAASIIVAFVVLMTNLSKGWIPIAIGVGIALSLGIGFAVVLISAPIYYFLMFRTSAKKIAERVDRLGLDERLITMMELEKDESFIALRQRDDAKERLKAVNRRQLKITISMIPVMALLIIAVCAAGMVTFSSVSYADKLPYSDPSVKESIYKEGDQVPVTYETNEGGYINGESDQIVYYGEDAYMVVAEADEGYGFIGWMEYDEFVIWMSKVLDGEMEKPNIVSESPERTDMNVTDQIHFIAVFWPLDGNGGGGSGGDSGENGEEKPQDGEQPSEEGGDPTDKNEPQTGQGGGAGGQYEEINKIIDGDVYYRNELEYYYEEAMKNLAENSELSPEMRAYIEMFYKLLK